MRKHHPHPRLQQRLSRPHQIWVYGAGGSLSLSGVAWLICHYLLRAAGPGPQPQEVWWLRIHGAALVAFLIVSGSVLPIHVRYGWRHRMNRGTGVPVLLVLAVLAISGYGLYYVVDDDWRAGISIVHWTLGLLAMGLVVLHVVRGRHTARALRHPDHHASQPRQPSLHPGHRPPS